MIFPVVAGSDRSASSPGIKGKRIVVRPLPANDKTAYPVGGRLLPAHETIRSPSRDSSRCSAPRPDAGLHAALAPPQAVRTHASPHARMHRSATGSPVQVLADDAGGYPLRQDQAQGRGRVCLRARGDAGSWIGFLSFSRVVQGLKRSRAFVHFPAFYIFYSSSSGCSVYRVGPEVRINLSLERLCSFPCGRHPCESASGDTRVVPGAQEAGLRRSRKRVSTGPREGRVARPLGMIMFQGLRPGRRGSGCRVPRECPQLGFFPTQRRGVRYSSLEP